MTDLTNNPPTFEETIMTAVLILVWFGNKKGIVQN